LHNFVITTLKNWLRIRPNTDNSFCFLNLTSLEQLSSRTVQRKIKKIVEEADIPNRISPHGLRRTFATILSEKCRATFFDIQGMLGHAPGTTERYVGSSLSRQKELLCKIHIEDEG